MGYGADAALKDLLRSELLMGDGGGGGGGGLLVDSDEVGGGRDWVQDGLEGDVEEAVAETVHGLQEVIDRDGEGVVAVELLE